MSDSAYFIRPVQPEDVVSLDSLKDLCKRNETAMSLAYSGTAHLLVGTIRSFHRRLHSLMPPSVGQAVYEKSPHLAVATPAMVSAYRQTSEKQSPAFHNGKPFADQKAYI